MTTERTTITLEADVAAELRRLRRLNDGSFKGLVNEVLRLGLRQLAKEPAVGAGTPIRTSSVDLGECRIQLDDVAEALAMAEGENFK